MAKNPEEIQLDKYLYYYSNLEYPGDDYKPTPPKSIAEYRARTQKLTKPGLFDSNPEVEDVTYFVSGRGKYVKGKIIKPGEPIQRTNDEDEKLRKKIREVCGLGYSNDISERMLVNETSEEESSTSSSEAAALPNTRLVSTKLKKESSKV